MCEEGVGIKVSMLAKVRCGLPSREAQLHSTPSVLYQVQNTYMYQSHTCELPGFSVNSVAATVLSLVAATAMTPGAIPGLSTPNLCEAQLNGELRE